MGRTSDARERLIESGASLIHERGYTAVGVSEVCARAGVNKGSFYHFFPSKQELALAVIDEHWARYEPTLETLVEGPGDPLARIRCFFQANIAGHVSVKESCGQVLGCPFGNLALEMATQDEALRESLHRYFGAIGRKLAAVLDEAVDVGELPPQDVQSTAQAMLALLQGELMMAKLSADPESLHTVTARVLQLAQASAAA